jgi:MFS family permease
VHIVVGILRAFGWVGARARGRVVQAVGGPARARVIVLFGGVLALSSAQIATVGAVAPELEQSLHIGNTKIGLLNSVALLVGAVTVLPVGLLVDRIRRIPMLAFSMILWSATTILGAIASSYSTLLLTRVGLGAVAATAGPAVASLTGDYFPARERARVYGYILSGEIAGTAAGFIVSGTLASAFSWRVAFFVLALPGFFLARSLWRTVPEPQRGGQSRLEPGTVDLASASAGAADTTEAQEDAPVQPERDFAREAALSRGFKPDPDLVLDHDPAGMSLQTAVRYVLRVPTNLLLIISSSLGYFYFAGLQTFALVFLRGRYGASEATATLVLGLLVLGSLIGTLISGPISDVLTRRGYFEARILVPAVANLAAAGLLVPGLLSGHLGSAVWFFVAGAGFISAANPPLDAARLDIMPAGLWGRAESIRTFLRSLAQALAPLIFGAVADLIAGFVPPQAPIGTHAHKTVTSATGTGLQICFLIMLVTLAGAGAILLWARGTYPTDVATAAASWSASPGAAPAVAPE